MSRKAAVIVGALLAVLVIVGQGVRHRTQMAVALKESELRQERADSLQQHADSLQVIVAEKVRVLVRRDTVLLKRTEAVQAEPVPENCEEVVAERDALIGDWREQAGNWRSQFETQLGVSADLRAANDELTVGMKGLRDAVKAQERRFSFFGRLLHPELRPSAFAGICSDGRPCVGVGVSLVF